MGAATATSYVIGGLPDEVRCLFKVAAIEAFCRRADLETIDAGPKVAAIVFRDSSFTCSIHKPAR